MMRHRLRYGPLVFRDPLLLCGTLYVLLYFDASGFLRLGLLAAFLHEWGHIGVYLALFGQFPVIEVTLTGFCMRTRAFLAANLLTGAFNLLPIPPLDGAQLAACGWWCLQNNDCISRQNRVQ